MKDECPLIELTERFNRMPADVECPHCGDKYHTHIPYANVPCRKCGITYRTDFKQSFYDKIAKKILSSMAYNNGIRFEAAERFEGDITLIQKHFTEMNCWDVSNIERIEREYKICNKCGVCLNCFTCKECGTSFTKNPDKRKQMCPNCKSDKFIMTYFKEVYRSEENKDIKLCPQCKSERIVMTKSRKKSKCHICGSKKLSEPLKNTIFLLTIKRKRGYRKK